MKKLLCPLLAIGLIGMSLPASAADAKAELQELVQKVQAKLKDGKHTEQDLADDLKKFDAIVAEHKDEKTDEVSQVLVMKGLLYQQVLEDDEKAIETYKKIKAEYPETKAGKKIDGMIAALESQREARKIQKSLAPGVQFPDFAVKDLDGKPLSVSNFKGKVVLIDFWATWCGPCRAELPNVVKAYEKYHDKGFEVIGVSLDQDKEKLLAFIKENKMPWAQYFDGKGWQNEVSTKYGVNSIPATYLLDKEGKIIDKNLRGEALDAALGKAL